MSVEGGIGAFMEGLAGGMKSRQQSDRRDAALALKLQEQQQQQMGALSSGDPNVSAPSAPGGGGPLKVGDPVATDLAPHQRAFLNAISDGESGGKYNVRYTPSGGAIFDDLSKHPGIMERGPNGPSSAAGRYQFTKSTWDGMGGGSFAPENQDRRAWQLAQSDYKARTGGDLDSDLQKGGLTPQIMKALQPTWTSFGSNGSRHIAAYNDSLSRFASNSAPASDTPAGKSIIRDTPTPKGGVIKIMSDLFPQSRGIADATQG
jgi:muramidase (phage lysozyme)